ncbi:zinc-binding alcohol dehydrogenase family protein [Corynebacterium variabile]|uniref:zinc-binding alcohol dehydrogenase family protein n=1 Tax=Corynebacterium variabile TaxID=1727 RepID=UPI001D2B29BE|nr:zinc-binding alcohol dehydrogenase family protein [Corynebacterium variabile]HJG45981.1 zinc-binding alcohol dehydrogenase family protein [Corynebacterium variabile]
MSDLPAQSALPATMPAVAVTEAFPVTDPRCLTDVVIDVPSPGPRDLLVEVAAVSVNPIDTKMRRRAAAAVAAGEQPVLGYDAAGTVVAVGSGVERFTVGDAVFYAGSQLRPGTNSRFHAVDERIVGRAPSSVSLVDAASLPLTALTAWEALFERLGIGLDAGIASGPASPASLLVVGGAGGVPSIMIQLARALTGLTVVATAGRDESREWVTTMGAHHVLDHKKELAGQVAALQKPVADGGAGLPPVRYVFTSQSGGRSGDLAALMAPASHLCLIDDPESFELGAFKRKSISLHWESMFTKVIFGDGDAGDATVDPASQGRILDRVADLVDAGRIVPTIGETLAGMNAEAIADAHRDLENGHVTGKIVVRV